MGLINDEEVVIAPVQRFEVDVAGVPGFATQIGVTENVVTEAVGPERIERVVQAIDRPVVAELFRAEDKDAFVPQLEKLPIGEEDPHEFRGGDGRERFVGFAETDAVSEDATVVRENLVDDSLHAVLLEIKERLPNLCVEQRRLVKIGVSLARVAKELLEDVKQRFVIDELWRVVLVDLREVRQDIGFDIRYQVRVGPELVEPRLEFVPLRLIVDGEVEFDIAARGLQAEAARGEVGTAEDGGVGFAIADVVELAVKKIRLLHGFDVHLPPDPFRAVLGDALLLERVRQVEAVGVDDELFLLRLVRIEGLHESRLAEQEIHVLNLVQVRLERLVGVDGEVRGDDGEIGAGVQVRPKVVSDGTAKVVIANAGRARRVWHKPARFCQKMHGGFKQLDGASCAQAAVGQGSVLVHPTRLPSASE